MAPASMKTLTATYRIVTPMFCAGADKQSAEFRLASFKGALRFWWRSLLWDKVRDVADLHRREAELFGASDQKTGQSKVRMRLVNSQFLPVVSPPAVFEQGRLSGAHYLGYGVMEAFESRNKGTKAGQLTRAMIPGGTFTVELRFSPTVSDEAIDEVRRSCVLAGTAGGLGSKSRKGLGSLTINSMKLSGESLDIPQDAGQRLRSVVQRSNLPDSLPHWTAWSEKARVVLVTVHEKRKAIELLDQVGREEVHFRSWGRNDKVLDQDSEKNFPFDHDLSKGKIVVAAAPYRTAFGLPHNYGKGKELAVEPAQHERRGSTLFIHADQFSDSSPPQILLVFLPSTFLPNDEQIMAFNRKVIVKQDSLFWFPIHGFLDRLTSNGTKPNARPGYENFPNESQWWTKATKINAQEVTLG